MVWMPWLVALPGWWLLMKSPKVVPPVPSSIPAQGSYPWTIGNYWGFQILTINNLSETGAQSNLHLSTVTYSNSSWSDTASLTTGCQGSSNTRVDLYSKYMLNLDLYSEIFRLNLHCYILSDTICEISARKAL